MRTLVFLLFLMGVLAAHEFPDSFYQTLKKQQCLPTKNVIIVKVKEQKLELYRNGQKMRAYTISTGKKGVGQVEGSEKTPLGLHRIAKKIGTGAPPYAIFEARQYKGKVWRGQKKYAERDLVLTRILWLDGLEEGYNKNFDSETQCVDSYRRYVYIHSTNHEDCLGKPASHGCVRMSAAGSIDLYSLVDEGDLVWIGE